MGTDSNKTQCECKWTSMQCHNLYTCNRGRMDDYDERNDYSTTTTVKDNCNPAIEDASYNLETAKIYKILSEAGSAFRNKLSTSPPVKPIGGTIYLFDLGPFASKWDFKKTV